jgi:hypothetical protein
MSWWSRRGSSEAECLGRGVLRLRSIGRPFSIALFLAAESVVTRASETPPKRTSAHDMLYWPRRGERNSVVLMCRVQPRNPHEQRASSNTRHGWRHLRSGRRSPGVRTGSPRSIVVLLSPSAHLPNRWSDCWPHRTRFGARCPLLALGGSDAP